MSKGYSGHFSGTKGAKHGSGTIKSQQQQKAVEWAKNHRNEVSRRIYDKMNTVTVAYDESTGKYYYGKNGGISLNNSPKNPVLFGENGILPKSSLNRFPLGHCAEVDAINNALNDGAKLSNLHIYTIGTTKKDFGTAKCACENCTYAFKGKVKSNNSGWRN